MCVCVGGGGNWVSEGVDGGEGSGVIFLLYAKDLHLKLCEIFICDLWCLSHLHLFQHLRLHPSLHKNAFALDALRRKNIHICTAL